MYIHISLNIGPRILNPNTSECPFPLAGHRCKAYTRNPTGPIANQFDFMVYISTCSHNKLFVLDNM